MAILKVQHSFQGVSLLAEDQYVNVFWFGGTDLTGASLLALGTAVEDFYHEVPTGKSQSIDQFLSGTADGPGARTRIYNLSDPEPRSPIHENIYDPTAFTGGGTNLPQEIACCLSYAAAPVSGVPIARLRGRLYIGPLRSTTVTPGGSVSVNSSVDADFRGVLLQAAADMAAQASTAGYEWIVYSPTLNAGHPVVRTWSDDAWDVQRRRGLRPSSRVSDTL